MWKNNNGNKFRVYSLILTVFIMFYQPFSVCGTTNKNRGDIVVSGNKKEARVEYGVSVLKDQLAQEVKQGLEKDIPTFIVGQKGDREVKKYLTKAELKNENLQNHEGFIFKRIIDKDKEQIIIIGSQPQGVMYGCIDVAEKIRLNGLKSLPSFYASSPVMQLRAYQFNYPTFVRGCAWDDSPIAANRLYSWFYDMDSVSGLLDKLAESKYNALILEAAHPFPAICPIDGYPEAIKSVEEHQPLTFEKLRNERIPYLRKLFTECRRRGIVPYVSMWNAFTPQSVMETKGIKVETPLHLTYPPEGMAKYNKAALKAFGNTYGDLAGIFIWNQEILPHINGTPEEFEMQNRWLRDVLIEGLLESSHRPVCIVAEMQAHLAKEAFTKTLLDYPAIEYLGKDHDLEVLTQPEMSKNSASELIDWIGVGGIKGVISYTHLGGWGSGNIAPYPWFSFSFMKRRLKQMQEFEITGSTSQPMRDVYFPDAYKRDWFFISGMGRFLWDGSEAQESYFRDLVMQRYGCSKQAAQAFIQAYEKAGDIPALFSTQFFYANCSNKFQFGVPLISGIWCGDLHAWAPGMVLNDGRDNNYQVYWVKPFGLVKFPDKLVDPVSYIKDNPSTETSPDWVADTLEADAKACLENINIAADSVKKRNKEFAEQRENIEAYHYMGMHMSEKIRALLDMLRFLRKGDQNHYDSGKQHLQKSLDYYLKQRQISKKIYGDADTNMHLPAPGCYVRHDWDSILPILHDEIEQYDKYLIQLAMHLAADRNTSGPSMALRDFYRRMAGDVVEVWRPWLPENKAEYWRNKSPKLNHIPVSPHDY